MVNRVLQPQELEVFYVIPALRREFSLRLKESGKSQKDIAKVLGVEIHGLGGGVVDDHL